MYTDSLAGPSSHTHQQTLGSAGFLAQASSMCSEGKSYRSNRISVYKGISIGILILCMFTVTEVTILPKAIYIYQSTVCHLPVTMDSGAKTLSNGFPDRTAHGLVPSPRGLQDVTSKRRTRNHLFWLNKGQAPSTLHSHITQQILTQLPAYWA